MLYSSGNSSLTLLLTVAIVFDGRHQDDDRSVAQLYAEGHPMPPAPSPNAPLVACVNSSDDIVQMLREVFVMDGFRAVPCVSTLTDGPEKMIGLLQSVNPDACVFTISPPYAEKWQEFQQVRQALPNCGWVVTTTNKRALDEIVGPTNTIELYGKPFDIEEVIDAVRRVLEMPVNGRQPV